MPTPILEDVIVDQIWEIKDGTERFYLNSSDGKLYRKDFLCDDFLIVGDWIVDGNTLRYRYFDGSLEIIELFGEVETFSVEEIIPTSDHSACVNFSKTGGKVAVAFFYYITKGRSKGWKYFFPTDSHVNGFQAFLYYKLEAERRNYSKNF